MSRPFGRAERGADSRRKRIPLTGMQFRKQEIKRYTNRRLCAILNHKHFDGACQELDGPSPKMGILYETGSHFSISATKGGRMVRKGAESIMAREQVSSILRAIRILECFTDSETEWTLKALVGRSSRSTRAFKAKISSIYFLFNKLFIGALVSCIILSSPSLTFLV